MQYARTVIGYHGCDQAVAERLLGGERFSASNNAYDWLGKGIYFWEWGADRAWRFAQVQQSQSKIKEPAIVGALIQLGRCFDLMDTRFTHDLADFYPQWKQMMLRDGRRLPTNKGGPPDYKGRFLDCAVINAYLHADEVVGGIGFDTVRCGFTEGPEVFEGSGFRMETHIQLAVRNPDTIVGVCRPTPPKRPTP